jgi:IS30 family transposase
MTNYLEQSKRSMRPLEDLVLDRIEHAEHIEAFAHAINPQDLLIVTALSSGMSQAQLAKRLEVSKNVISKRIKRVRSIALYVFGEEAIDGRELRRTKRNESVVLSELEELVY